MEVYEALPEPGVLKRVMQVQAALDLILCEEDWLRYHRYSPQWRADTAMANVDNGSGDHLFILFSPQGVIMKGFDHESSLSPHAGEEYEIWPGIYDRTPQALLALLEDEAIEKDEVSFCIWRGAGDNSWRKGQIVIPDGADDGSGFLLGTIRITPEKYADWAENYFDMELPLEMVKGIYRGSPITESAIRALNPERDVRAALRELQEIGLNVDLETI